MTHVLADFQDSHVEIGVLLLVLVEEGFEVLVHGVQERIDPLKGLFGHVFDHSDSVINQCGEFLPLVPALLREQIQLVEEDLAALDELFVT